MHALTEKKQGELRAFTAACEAGLPIQAEDIAPGEEPDLRVSTAEGMIGIEVSEVLPLASNPSFNSSLAEARNHEASVHLAEQVYYQDKNAIPIEVTAYPWSIERTRNTKRKMAVELASFVKAHCPEATPVKSFGRIDEIPQGFGVVTICSIPGPWSSNQSVGVTLDGIFRQLANRIASKGRLLPTYRINLPNVPIWLLLYSGWEVARSVPIPSTIREWAHPFEFDRVFFFAASSQCVEEIQRA